MLKLEKKNNSFKEINRFKLYNLKIYKLKTNLKKEKKKVTLIGRQNKKSKSKYYGERK